MANTTTSSHTVVGLFDNMEQASKAARELETAGISSNEISIVAANESGKYADYSSGTGEVGKGVAGGAGAGAAIGGGLGLLAGLTALAIPGFGPIIAAGPIAAALTGAGVGAASGGLIGGLAKAGVPDTDAHYYEEGLRRGGVIVTARADENLADKVSDIFDDNGARDIEERGQEWTQAGWKAPAGQTLPTTDFNVRGTDFNTTARPDVAGDRAIPVVEEHLHVGKREAGRRSVRLYTNVTDRPVEEKVQLREETVHVDRRPADRPATEADLTAFREGTIELTEVREEAVVSKHARVVEEVVFGKDVNIRTETVKDNVRRTDVVVDKTDATDYDQDFRTDYQTRYGKSGRDFEYYAPGYRFGSTIAADSRFKDREWSTVESDLRRDWDTRGQGKWEDFKDTIRHGWDRVRGRR
ncbi:MAG: YsnF/AvaK domain-containing protein [Bryobacteraceae bacterium]|nr:YsnF/AvaK domain-containing protein [Bryobacteraceae bacterium]